MLLPSAPLTVKMCVVSFLILKLGKLEIDSTELAMIPHLNLRCNNVVAEPLRGLLKQGGVSSCVISVAGTSFLKTT